jgi:hypothetical protein
MGYVGAMTLFASASQAIDLGCLLLSWQGIDLELHPVPALSPRRHFMAPVAEVDPLSSASDTSAVTDGHLRWPDGHRASPELFT